MIDPRLRGRLAVGISLGAAVALLAIPATRPLFYDQAKLSAGWRGGLGVWSYTTLTQDDPTPPGIVASFESFAQKHPTDYSIQLGMALVMLKGDGPSGQPRTQYLTKLIHEFPRSPSAYATFLRYMCRAKVNLHRSEQAVWDTVGAWPAGFAAPSKRSNKEDLDQFEAVARAGADLDPQNAYFAAMLSIALLEERRDPEAIQTMDWASRLQNWNEYVGNEVAGKNSLLTGAYGQTGVLAKAAIARSVILPHLARLRAACQTLVTLAIQDERSGKFEDGLMIRESVLRIGAMIRSDSTTAIASLFGVSLCRLSMSRPDGDLPVAQSGITSQELLTRQLEAFKSYLGRTAQLKVSAQRTFDEFQSETDANISAGGIIRGVLDSSERLDPAKVARAWILGIVLLGLAGWFFATWLVVWICSRMRSQKWREPVLTLTTCLLAYIFSWQLAHGVAAVGDCAWGYGAVTDLPILSSDVLIVPIAMLCLLLTAVATGLMILLSGSKNLPRGQRYVGSVRSAALPAMGLLLVLYALTAPVTIRVEREQGDKLNRTIDHEGRFMAELAGRSWPSYKPLTIGR